jgi:hypothetical protein
LPERARIFKRGVHVAVDLETVVTGVVRLGARPGSP